MSEANLARRGGGIKLRKSTTPDSVSSPSVTRQSPPLLSRRGVLWLLFLFQKNVITFFLRSPYKPFRMTGGCSLSLVPGCLPVISWIRYPQLLQICSKLSLIIVKLLQLLSVRSHDLLVQVNSRRIFFCDEWDVFYILGLYICEI